MTASTQRPDLSWDDEHILAWREQYLNRYNATQKVPRISNDSWKRANLWDYVNDEPDAAAMVSRRVYAFPSDITPIQRRIMEFLRLEGRATSPGLTAALGNNRSNIDDALRRLRESEVIEVVDEERSGSVKRRVYALTKRWESL